MKKFATVVFSLGMLVGSCTAVWASTPEIVYNGQSLDLRQPVVIQDGRTLLALRDIAEQMQIPVQWEEETRTATVTTADAIVTLQPDTKRIACNGQCVQTDVGPQILNERIYLPLRSLFELLGAEVQYRQSTDGTAWITVKDAVSKNVLLLGRETKIARHATNAMLTFFDHRGQMVEVSKENGNFVMYYTNIVNGQTEKQQEPSSTYETITGLLEQGQKYYAVLDKTQSSRYIGNGYQPEGKALLKEIYTPQGVYAFYESHASIATLALEDTSGFSKTNVKGYLLDIANSTHSIQDTSYAFVESNTYGFLTDGQLLLLANVPVKGYQMVACDTVSDTMKTGRLFVQGDTFTVIGSDTASNGKAELYAASYTKQGQKSYSYTQLTHFGDKKQYRYLNITDAVQIGETVYLLLKTNTSCSLACYNLTTHQITSESLDRNYERFVPVGDGWQLYASEKESHIFLRFAS